MGVYVFVAVKAPSFNKDQQKLGVWPQLVQQQSLAIYKIQ